MLLLTSLMASAADGSLERGSSMSTTFGHVRVDGAHLQAATEEGEAAYSAAKTVLGLRKPRFSIVELDYTSHNWGDRASDGTFVYVWQFNKGPDDQRQIPPAYLLRHEIGHDLFIRHLAPSTKADQYGGDAPDWLDEMAAVAFEGEALRSTRRRGAVRYAQEGKLIPLQRFLAMTHPEMEAGSIPDPSDRLVRPFEPASDDTPRFYVMASAFYDFLVARTKNPAIVAELAAAFRKGQPLERWILARTGNKGGIQALNADFQAWVATDARYGGGSGH
ncbi:MAG: hypothetical protein WBR13_09490 [Allosphingosinicella sp.]